MTKIPVKRGSKKKTEPSGENKGDIAKTGARPRRRGGAKSNRQAEVVSQLLETVESKLTEGEVKPTVGDFIRLLQLQKELEEGEVREVTVEWLGKPETEESKDG